MRSNRHDSAVIDKLIAERPSFHGPDEADRTDQGIQSSFIRYLAQTIQPNWLTLEVGCGVSTVAFAASGAEHICVSPDSCEHDRVISYCRENGIDTSRLKMVAAGSQNYLPILDLNGRELDFALIDGCHAFPMPIVDFYYVNRHLKVGGMLAIDDLFIPSVNLLQAFLKTDTSYQFLLFDSKKTAIYRKTAEAKYSKWEIQKYNERRPDFSHLPYGDRMLMTVAHRLKVREGGFLWKAYHTLKRE